VNGKSQLYAARLNSPDVRAGMSLIMAALVANGTSVIDNIYQVERGYFDIENKLRKLGAVICRED
jgi:UDP-N-acetylglucosamine 1-carboxyvinyltransferase